MVIAFLADDSTKEEILSKPKADNVEYIWTDSMSSLLMIEADAYFDFQFDADPERSTRLKKIKRGPVFINAVAETIDQAGADFIRINGWPGMIQRSVLEISTTPRSEEAAQKVFEAAGWKYLNLPDIPGFVTARVIAMIINEAYYTFEAGISSKDDIDTAMKLGTNYPYGPFEWAQKIGVAKIVALLEALSKSSGRYQISAALLKEAKESKSIQS